jgi:two-component system, chemotaxis family, chemotaxis protein CheY
MKVLLVEDARGMRKLILAMLRSHGYTDVDEAVNGKEAWQQIRYRPPDLLLTNWGMPVMDGIELVRKVRQDALLGEMPIVMFTARSAKEDVVCALQAGVDAYVAKPFTPPQLQAKITSIMGKRSLQRIQDLLGNQDRGQADSNDPVVILAEGAITVPHLRALEQKETLAFLCQAAAAIKHANSSNTDVHLCYVLENNTRNVAARLRALGSRARLLIVAADLPGGGVTLARLVGANWGSSVAVFLVSRTSGEISAKVRSALEHLGVTVFQRHLDALDSEAMEGLLNEYVLAPMRSGVSSALPAPEEIRQRLESDIRTMVSLPVLPQVYHDITALDKRRDSDIREWIEAIETDPLSRAQVIRRAHSPVYGFRGEISDTNKAVILLGKNAIKEIIVSGTVRRSFEGIEEHGFDMEDFWLHSVGVAFAAQALSFPLDKSAWTPDQEQQFEEMGLGDDAVALLQRLALYGRLATDPEDDPFVSGMMHDIGKVALIQSYPGLYKMIIDELDTGGWRSPMLSAEQSVAGGADHTVVGRILSQSWKLGDSLVAAVEKHHAPGSDRSISLLALADFIGGGIFAYPKTARFPMVQLLDAGYESDPSPAAPAEQVDADEQETATDSTPAGLEAAAQAFLPEGLLEQLELPFDDLLAVGRALAPSIRKRAGSLHSSQ